MRLIFLQVGGYAIILAGITIYNTIRTDKSDAEASKRPPSELNDILLASARSPLVWVLSPAVVCVFLVGVVGLRLCIVQPKLD